MFNFKVEESKNGMLVSSIEINGVSYCACWSDKSVVSIVTPNGEDGAIEFYHFPK